MSEIFEDALLYLEQWFWMYIELPIKHTICFFVGHNVKSTPISGDNYYGYYPRDYWCARCLIEDPPYRYEQICVPTFLHRAYTWVCRHGGEPFEVIDQWILDHFKVPKWWEY